MCYSIQQHFGASNFVPTVCGKNRYWCHGQVTTNFCPYTVSAEAPKCTSCAFLLKLITVGMRAASTEKHNYSDIT